MASNKTTNDINLDDLVAKKGTPIDVNSIKYIDKKVIEETINNTFAYDDSNTIIPGKDVEYKINEQINSLNEQTGLDSIITQAALLKAKKEKEEHDKLNQNNIANQLGDKKHFVEQMLYQQGELYYQLHHYIMDGRTKRITRKRIEKAYDKKKFPKDNIYFDKPKGVKYIQRPIKKKTETPVNINDLI